MTLGAGGQEIFRHGTCDIYFPNNYEIAVSFTIWKVFQPIISEVNRVHFNGGHPVSNPYKPQEFHEATDAARKVYDGFHRQ